MSQFDFIDPNAPGSDLRARPAVANLRDDIDRLGSHAWGGHLSACWGEITADSEPRLARSDEHVLGYCEMALNAVDHRLVELIREPEGSSSRGARSGIWCAAQALEASAMAWQRLHPSLRRTPRALVSRLQGQMAEGPPVLSTGAVAAKCRIAGAALDRLARSLGTPDAALGALEDAVIDVASIAIWADPPLRRGGQGLVDRAVTMHRLAADVVAAAAIEERARRLARESAADWLAIAIAVEAPAMSLAMIDDPDADRVLRAEALSVSSMAWIRRGALKLLALQRLERESNFMSRRCLRIPVHAAAAGRPSSRCR
jgi:hypothetical protein